MKLIEFLQKHTASFPMGGDLDEQLRNGTDQSARDDLRLVQTTNNNLFKVYFITLIAIVILTFCIAVAFHQEMGGMAIVLGTGGTIQGGLVLKLANVWMDKARIDIIATLAIKLPADKLHLVLEELSRQLGK